MKDARRKQMEELIARRQTVSMEELCQLFQVCMNTVRADVAHLVRSGAVEKVYGGVRAAQSAQVPLFSQRMTISSQAKLAIARRAEELICDGDRIYIDAGTTTMALLDCLQSGKHVTVLTRNLHIITRALDRPEVELIVLPGMADRRTHCLADAGTLEFLGRYQLDKAFMGVSGISPQGQLNVSSYIEYELKRQAMARSGHSYLLADAGKFGQTGLMSYGTLTDLTAVVTDRPDSELAHLCRAQNVPLLVSEG